MSIELKIIVLGTAGVGKTCLINQYCNGTYHESTLNTIGAGFHPKTIILEDKEINIMLWDTAGEERFKSVAPSLIKGANGLILVYEVTSCKSLTELEDYLKMFLDYADVSASSTNSVLLLGNKCDLPHWEVSENTLKQWLDEHQIENSEIVSAKTGMGVESAFTKFLTSFASEPPPKIDMRPLKLRIDSPPSQPKKCC